MVDERAVRQALDRSSEAIHVGQLQSLLRAQVQLNEEAECDLRAVKDGLIRLLETVSPDQVDPDPVGKPPLQALPPKGLISMLELRLAAAVTAAGREPKRPEEISREAEAPIRRGDFEALRNELGTSREKLASVQSMVETLQRDLSASREQNKFLLEERKRLLENLALLEGRPAEEKDQASEPGPSSPAEGEREHPAADEPPQERPDWLIDWQGEKTFERDKCLLLLLGETGLSRRPAVEAALARELGIKQTTRTLRSLIGRLQDGDLVDVTRPWKDASLAICSRLPDIVKLTERGRQAFSMLAGRPPKDPDLERLIARYSSPEKALLVLVAADALVEGGCNNAEYANGKVPAPADLVVDDRDGRTISVAVVREDPGNPVPEGREGRWLLLHELTRGNLYVVCDSRACMHTVRSQINHALGTRPASIHLTNLADLQAGKRGEEGSIWLEVKRSPQPGGGV